MSKTFPAKFTDVWPYDTDYCYDIECYPNYFSLAAEHMTSGSLYFFEISQWRDDSDALITWIYWLHQHKCRQIGFNNEHYDYRMEHFFFMNAPAWQRFDGLTKAKLLYEYSCSLFKYKGESEDEYRTVCSAPLFVKIR